MRGPTTLATAAILVGCLTLPARADEVRMEVRGEPSRPTLIYGELLGKGGPYGLGVEHAITPRLALGAVASVAVIRGQQLYTLAPYVHVTIGRRGRHALFGELGLAIVHSRIPSPVASWDGATDTGAGGVATVGWERRGARTVIRSYLAAELGEGGLAPWLGIAFGVRL